MACPLKNWQKRLVMASGLIRRGGLILGLDFGPGSWKVLSP